VINKRSKCYLADRLMFQYSYKRGRGEYVTTNMESYQNNMYSSAMSYLRSQHGEWWHGMARMEWWFEELARQKKKREEGGAAMYPLVFLDPPLPLLKLCGCVRIVWINYSWWYDKPHFYEILCLWAREGTTLAWCPELSFWLAA